MPIENNRKIDVVLFDFGGVLAEEGWRNGFMKIAEAHGMDGQGLVEAASDTVYETGYILGKGTRQNFWKTFKEKTGIVVDEEQCWRDIVARFTLRGWMMALVQRLKAQKRIVGILSDQIDMLDEINTRDNFFKAFDHVFNSYHIGKGKRDASLFDDIALQLKTPAERILFIDDHPGNVERARQRGWNAILYTDQASFLAEFAQWVPGAVPAEGPVAS